MLQIVLQEEVLPQQAVVRELVLLRIRTIIPIIVVHNEMVVVHTADQHKLPLLQRRIVVQTIVLGIGQEGIVILQIHLKEDVHQVEAQVVRQAVHQVVVEMAEVVQEAHVSTINKLLTRKDLAISGVFSSNDCLRQNL